MTVRQVFYQATERGIIEKTEGGYPKVQTDVTVMRLSGDLPYGWLADNTRWQRKPRMFDSVEEALAETARLYRKDLWSQNEDYVEIWLEKDALAGVNLAVHLEFRCAAHGGARLRQLVLLVLRGRVHHGNRQANLHVSSRRFRSSGINAGEKIEETLRELAPDADIYFERTAVTPKQIWKLGVADSATKATDTRAKGFGEISVELDAVEPDMVRQLVEHALEVHLPADQYDVLKIAEEASGPSCAASRRSGAPKTWP